VLKAKVITPDSKGLPSQKPQRYLARFIAGFGILYLGGENEKGSAGAEPFCHDLSEANGPRVWF
jgi:hypothetical protein